MILKSVRFDDATPLLVVICVTPRKYYKLLVLGHSQFKSAMLDILLAAFCDQCPPPHVEKARLAGDQLPAIGQHQVSGSNRVKPPDNLLYSGRDLYMFLGSAGL